MEKGFIHYFCGEGKGKTSAAVGEAVKAAGAGFSVVIIQFLKGKETGYYELLNTLEPQIKLFSFEKSEASFRELSEQERNTELQNIKNGVNYARKVLSTGECDLVVLDEFLGLVDTGILTVDEFHDVLSAKPDYTSVIVTGIKADGAVAKIADQITTLTTVCG